MNRILKAAAAGYADGDFAHIESVDEARDVGDTLFSFIMVELDEAADDDPEIAVQLLNNAIRDIQDVIRGIEQEFDTSG